MTGVEGITESYVSDTLCALLERLADEKAERAEVTILEIRPEGEFPVLLAHCVNADGRWLRRPEACRYRDRTRKTDGPFVEYEPPEAVVKAGKG